LVDRRPAQREAAIQASVRQRPAIDIARLIGFGQLREAADTRRVNGQRLEQLPVGRDATCSMARGLERALARESIGDGRGGVRSNVQRMVP
ncbi:MAG: hypothetical protein WKH68_08600, partial [Candidatus Limnocylindria bacterium]